MTENDVVDIGTTAAGKKIAAIKKRLDHSMGQLPEPLPGVPTRIELVGGNAATLLDWLESAYADVSWLLIELESCEHKLTVARSEVARLAEFSIPAAIPQWDGSFSAEVTMARKSFGHMLNPPTWVILPLAVIAAVVILAIIPSAMIRL